MNHGSELSFSIKTYLDSEDPLSVDAIKRLLSHKEEDLFVDYKVTFDDHNEKHWHGITTDAMAFANTLGGYLVFGVRDADFSVNGLSEESINALKNTNMVIQKLNRYVLPPFSLIRTKEYTTESGAKVVIMHVPESKGKTHIFVKKVTYKYPSGETTHLSYPGMIFVRRSATNHVVNPDDLDFIISRRIEYYKESILKKICKVVEAPAEHQILVFDPNEKGRSDNTYLISDRPDALPVKGMSFTVAPRTDFEEICGWISLSKRDPTFKPSETRLWHMYCVRDTITLNSEQLLGMVKFSLFSETPIFYWIRNQPADHIKTILTQVFKKTSNQRIRVHVINVGAFLGKTFYTRLAKKQKESGYDLKSPHHDPFKNYCNFSDPIDKEKTEKKLTQIAKKLVEGKGGVIAKWEARSLDCWLYARKDKYIGNTSKLGLNLGNPPINDLRECTENGDSK